MENYKFRAWHDNKMWQVRAIDWDYKGNVISCHLDDGEESIKIYPDEKYGDKVILMQYTGEYDKNYKDIYDGDIVQCSQKGQTMKGVVTFSKGMWSWQYGKERNDSYLYEAVKRWKGVIVGNIWEDGEFIDDCEKTEKN
jgi:uncharacterized phage protein (TIGR01671 family)